MIQWKKSLKIYLVLFFIFYIGNAFANNYNSINPRSLSLESEIEQTLLSAQTYLLQTRQDNKYWNYPLYLGSMYTSQYILIRHWLESNFIKNKIELKKLPNSRFDEVYFKNYLFQSQLKDGSWPIIQDLNSLNGDLNTTIAHYAALKAMGAKTTLPELIKAKMFILKNGGIKNASIFTKILLSLFGNYSWEEIPNIPYILFDEHFFLNYKNFGQWIAPHLFPISYLEKAKTLKQLGPNFDLSELWINVPESVRKNNLNNYYSNSYAPDYNDRALLLKILTKQKPNGSFGGYTSATLFSLMALENYQYFQNDLDKDINSAIIKGINFVDNLYFNSGDSSYLGTTCDGRYWDTAFIGQGLLESNLNQKYLTQTSKYLLEIQNYASGGYGFGLDFEDVMDTDDTAEILLYFKKSGIENYQKEKTINWLFTMQNDDGGWGAFDRNNTGNFILKFATREFLDSADMFDESSADVTGHILEALSAFGYTIKNSQAVRNAVLYLSKSQDPNAPAWQGRWGSNYIYGTSSSLIGLIKAGVNPQTDLIQNSIRWLTNCQNKFDGGFGESFLSYSDSSKICQPSHTAWALMALIESGHGDSLVAQNAALYLLKSYKENGNQWVDKNTFVGTGHPKIVPMHYPSYAWAFSLMALSRYNKILKYNDPTNKNNFK